MLIFLLKIIIISLRRKLANCNTRIVTWIEIFFMVTIQILAIFILLKFFKILEITINFLVNFFKIIPFRIKVQSFSFWNRIAENFYGQNIFIVKRIFRLRLNFLIFYLIIIIIYSIIFLKLLLLLIWSFLILFMQIFLIIFI